MRAVPSPQPSSVVSPQSCAVFMVLSVVPSPKNKHKDLPFVGAGLCLVLVLCADPCVCDNNRGPCASLSVMDGASGLPKQPLGFLFSHFHVPGFPWAVQEGR